MKRKENILPSSIQKKENMTKQASHCYQDGSFIMYLRYTLQMAVSELLKGINEVSVLTTVINTTYSSGITNRSQISLHLDKPLS